MIPALAAGASALNAISSLVSSSSTSSQSTTGFSQTASTAFDVTAGATSPTIPPAGTGSNSLQNGGLSPATMSALIAAQDQSGTPASTTSRSAAMQDLFSQLDGNSDGMISKSEFESALGAGGTNVAKADSVFSKLDTDGDGSVSLSELTSALKGAGRRHGHRANAGANSGGGAAATGMTAGTFMPQLMGASGNAAASSTSTASAGVAAVAGSTGATSATGATATRTAISTYNQLEQAIQQQAAAFSANAAASLSINV